MGSYICPLRRVHIQCELLLRWVMSYPVTPTQASYAWHVAMSRMKLQRRSLTKGHHQIGQEDRNVHQSLSRQDYACCNTTTIISSPHTGSLFDNAAFSTRTSTHMTRSHAEELQCESASLKYRPLSRLDSPQYSLYYRIERCLSP